MSNSDQEERSFYIYYCEECEWELWDWSLLGLSKDCCICGKQMEEI